MDQDPINTLWQNLSVVFKAKHKSLDGEPTVTLGSWALKLCNDHWSSGTRIDARRWKSFKKKKVGKSSNDSVAVHKERQTTVQRHHTEGWNKWIFVMISKLQNKHLRNDRSDSIKHHHPFQTDQPRNLAAILRTSSLTMESQKSFNVVTNLTVSRFSH